MFDISIKVYIFFFLIFNDITNWFSKRVYPYFFTEKALGMSYLELVSFLVETKFNKETLVVLIDINPASKGARFWSDLPEDKRIILTRDVVILRCKDNRHMQEIIDSITKNFATAFGFEGGKLVSTNDY